MQIASRAACSRGERREAPPPSRARTACAHAIRWPGSVSGPHLETEVPAVAAAAAERAQPNVLLKVVHQLPNRPRSRVAGMRRVGQRAVLDVEHIRDKLEAVVQTSTRLCEGAALVAR